MNLKETENYFVLKNETESIYLEYGVDFTKTYFAFDGINEWVDPTTTRKVFEEIIERINPSPKWVFLDCGSGLGHVLYLAANKFSEVIGVEILPDIYRICVSNLDKILPGHTITIINLDLLKLDDSILDRVNVFYCSSPFSDEATFEEFIYKIANSIIRADREVYFIYYYPVFESVMNKVTSIFTIKSQFETIGRVNIYHHPV